MPLKSDGIMMDELNEKRSVERVTVTEFFDDASITILWLSLHDISM